MKFGQVIGKVVLHRSVPEYHAGRFLLVHPMGTSQIAGSSPLLPLEKGNTVVLWDDLGASEGDTVGYSESGEAAAAFPFPTPIDAYNTAIINRINHQPPTPEAEDAS